MLLLKMLEIAFEISTGRFQTGRTDSAHDINLSPTSFVHYTVIKACHNDSDSTQFSRTRVGARTEAVWLVKFLQEGKDRKWQLATQK